MTRPVNRRRGARVIVVAAGRVLLVADSDPGVSGSRWWVTPGGGVDGDEPDARAAARELFEETGLRLSPRELGEPVARRVAVHGYSDRVLVQDEVFFRVETTRFVPAPAALTATERSRMQGLAWCRLPPDDGRPVWPAELPELARGERGSTRWLGVVEESTVPLTAPDWDEVTAARDDDRR